MNTNYIELKEIFVDLFNGTLNLDSGLFAEIENKKVVLSEFLNVDIEKITYIEKRNLFILDEVNEEYNVLTDKEADIQSFISLYYAMIDDDFMLNVDDVKRLFNLNNETIYKIFDEADSDLNLVSINSVMNYSSRNNIYTIEELLFKLAKDINREYFLSCDYKENKIKDYFIYRC